MLYMKSIQLQVMIAGILHRFHTAISQRVKRTVKPTTFDRRDQNKQVNTQKQPWPLNDIHKFDRGLHKNDPGQHPPSAKEQLP